MQILLLGGGSLGHTAPAVAVGHAIRKIAPGTQLHMICSPREDEAEFLRAEMIPFSTIKIPRRGILLPFQFVRSYKEASKIIETFQPDVVFSKGGGLSLPVCAAAWSKKIPIVLHESDARAGYASRLIARIAKKVCVGFPSTDLRNGIFTGNPVRSSIAHGSREEGLRYTGLSGEKPILLISGGSQGAQSFNDVIRDQLDELLSICDIIHLTGRGKQTAAGKKSGYFAQEFALQALPHFYACATLALSRGGAGSISELAANGIPTIVVPLEGVAQNHQTENARQAEATGGVTLLNQSELQSNILSTVRSLLADPQKLREMSQKIRTLSLPDAAENIARIVLAEGEM